MFGSISHLLPTASAATAPPKDVPPLTPIHFPRCIPRASSRDGASAQKASGQPLPAVLQSIIRPTEVSMRHLDALGIDLRPDAPLEDIIPEMAFVPNFEAWDTLTYEQAREINDQTRRPLNNGNKSPGVQTYLDRRTELSVANEEAFRSVRRMQPLPGQSQVRLGNSYEFFRNLEGFSTYWDDTSAPPKPTAPESSGEPASTKSSEQQDGESSDSAAKDKPATPAPAFFRTGAGNQMPPEYRLNILTAFLKLVAYDFGCNVSAPRTEPRLYVNSGPQIPSSSSSSPPVPQDQKTPPLGEVSSPKGQSSYFSSGCTFIFRTPTTREAARAGIVEGPLAAVSARHTTTFPDNPDVDPSTHPDRESTIDLARELIAALLTAQHRAREGKTERRYGEGAWWATKPRWGGGSGGPIGREIDALSTPSASGNTDEAQRDSYAKAEGAGRPSPSSSASAGGPPPPGGLRSLPTGRSSAMGPAAKKPRRNMAMYDNYRMVRPPSAAWDKKTRYAPLGRAAGRDYDDIFVVSALFHHVSVLRVRVPDRLLEVLDGAVDSVGEGEAATRSWGKVEVVRSQWYDLFKPGERVRAMQLVWGVMAWLMRKDEDVVEERDGESGGRRTAATSGEDMQMGEP